MNKVNLEKLVKQYFEPKRVALSQQLPLLKKPIIWTRRKLTSLKNLLNPKITFSRSKNYFKYIVARHQSVLRRKLGDSSPRLQEQKITNLKQAIQKLDGVIIQPNDIFSLWTIIGQPKKEDGYVDGMLLSNGKVVEGLGGGLCQLSNFLYWIFLHAPTKIVQRYHHSMDVFPDSGRTLPFGSGATILYNFVDLKIQNISKYPIQLKIWITENHLKGQILSPTIIPEKFKIKEQDHAFILAQNTYFRYNQLYRETLIEGKKINSELITTNFAPVLYEVTTEYLKGNNFKLIKL